MVLVSRYSRLLTETLIDVWFSLWRSIYAASEPFSVIITSITNISSSGRRRRNKWSRSANDRFRKSTDSILHQRLTTRKNNRHLQVKTQSNSKPQLSYYLLICFLCLYLISIHARFCDKKTNPIWLTMFWDSGYFRRFCWLINYGAYIIADAGFHWSDCLTGHALQAYPHEAHTGSIFPYGNRTIWNSICKLRLCGSRLMPIEMLTGCSALL